MRETSLVIVEISGTVSTQSYNNTEEMNTIKEIKVGILGKK